MAIGQRDDGRSLRENSSSAAATRGDRRQTVTLTRHRSRRERIKRRRARARPGLSATASASAEFFNQSPAVARAHLLLITVNYGRWTLRAGRETEPSFIDYRSSLIHERPNGVELQNGSTALYSTPQLFQQRTARMTAITQFSALIIPSTSLRVSLHQLPWKQYDHSSLNSLSYESTRRPKHFDTHSVTNITKFTTSYSLSPFHSYLLQTLSRRHTLL